ncbi:T9SS type A sorting domain-containing protein [Cryomorpha ignava]|uniref:T9SS type A sorting domain-containing protein n=1 Tax=Cryomorpha ignava TaxID=101383 RepID=A0A7K3WNP9_9FLAO|nr:T9SS type A sorting domain-containing protein [Cryomorpha ignava]NEN23256.1 T9SS type A sorting domain-containing protein [Cryomorpha ignava]
MKKFTLIFLFLPLFATAQTVPNGNFESWFWVGWSENPEFWVTDNTELGPTVTKDFDSYEGEIAMRVTAQPTSLGSYGEANTLISLTEVATALNFYAKSEVENGSVAVNVTFLNGETEVYTVHWFGNENMEEYTLVSVPLSQVLPPPGIVTHARISVSAEFADLIGGTAWISVDAMEFGEPLLVKENELNSFKIYPNPTSDVLNLQTEASVESVDIFNITGEKIRSLNAPEIEKPIDVSALSKGVYLIRFNTATSSFVKRMVIE